ncbi:DUF3846 domain-containing protein [uncultured Bacteroides sp.]|uniref:DUF3846 domain-containing protein n=1 Tax=uncultured Bacteroides sp. TaxID=162156 RepID=UPI002596A04B|nr:DUF3846 domain-containing protein [uncultured Bacteroides sp.]
MDKQIEKRIATIIYEDGTEKEVSPKNGTDFKLEEMQDVVNGYIDIIRMGDGKIMVINDEGKFECEYNRRATEIAHSYGTLFPGDYISGNVILCDNDMVR